MLARGVCMVEVWAMMDWTTPKFPSGSYIPRSSVLWRSKSQGCPAHWWQNLSKLGVLAGQWALMVGKQQSCRSHLPKKSLSIPPQFLPAAPGPGCSSIPASFFSVHWPEPQLHPSSASGSLKLFLFSCKWAVYDDHYLNGLRRAPGCLSAADGRLIR